MKYFDQQIVSIVKAVIDIYPCTEMLPDTYIDIVSESYKYTYDDIECILHLDSKNTLVIIDTCYTLTDDGVEIFLDLIQSLKKFLSSLPEDEKYNKYQAYKKCDVVGFMGYIEAEEYALELAMKNSLWTCSLDFNGVLTHCIK